jgi:hypothetical protein
MRKDKPRPARPKHSTNTGEPWPGSNYRTPLLKGRPIRAAVVKQAIHGPDPFTPEEISEEYQVPLEAVFGALDESSER